MTVSNNGLSQKILIGLASVFAAALIPFFIWLGRATIDIQARMVAVESGVGRVEASITRIDEAATALAGEERARAAARIAELEGRARQKETR